METSAGQRTGVKSTLSVGSGYPTTYLAYIKSNALNWNSLQCDRNTPVNVRYASLQIPDCNMDYYTLNSS